MCLIVFAYRSHPHFPLVLAANRDEFYDRPTSKAHFWEDQPNLLAGKDLKYGGTWMGITTSGRFAAVTNFRDMTEFREHPLSRGLMVKEFLMSNEPPDLFLRKIAFRGEEYNGFNLLLGDTDVLLYHSNRTRETRALAPGIYGLSNHLLDTPWPKVIRSRLALSKHVEGSVSGPASVDIGRLFDILYDTNGATDNELPDTGFGLEWERVLSSPFIITPTYGTRASTVLLIDSDRVVRFEERTFTGPDEPGDTSRYQFRITGQG